MYEAKEIHDPIAGCLTKRIIYRPSNCKAARKSEIVQIVDRAYQETKGEGTRKLKVRTSHYYSGLSSNAIQKKIERHAETRKTETAFRKQGSPEANIKACREQERHQVGLVSLASMPATIHGDTYKYIMSVIDIFSFVFLCPLQTK